MYSIRNESKKKNTRDKTNSLALNTSVCDKMQSTGQPTKLFDKKFVATTLRNTRCCPKCRNEYSTNYDHRMGDVHVTSNRPFLLTCGHNMCENCIYQNHHYLVCGICQIPIVIQEPDQTEFAGSTRNENFNVRDFFYFNFFLIGELNHLRFYRRESSANNTLMIFTNKSPPSFPNNNNRTLQDAGAKALPAAGNITRCTECELEPAALLCRQCSVYYCRVCYDSIHMYGKALRRHTYVPLDSDHPGARRRIPRPINCRIHRRVKDRFCRQCRTVCCGLCAKTEHPNHRWTTLVNENERMKDEIVNLLDSVKSSRENLRKAQKDIKTVETQLEEYSTETIKNITEYFLQLHSFLQLREQVILDDFRSKCMEPQNTLRDAVSKLSESQTFLNKMRYDLELYQQNVPHDIYLRDMFDMYNNQLEQMVCRVQISKLTKNPFNFEVQSDLRKDFSKLYTYGYTDPGIKVCLAPMYSDINQSFDNMKTYSSDEMDVDCYTEKHKRKNNQRNNKKKRQSQRRNDKDDTSQNNNSTSEPETNDILVRDKEMVRISHVKTPEHFYIQTKSAIHQIRELSNKYVNFMQTDIIPKTIAEGQCYMIYHSVDKQWYRAMVKKALPKDLYKVFLVDIGMNVEMPTESFCEIDTKSLSIPFAAIRCAINDIMPSDNAWNEEANNLLIEITRNRFVRISIIERIKENMLSVDLFANSAEDTISVRDSFLYTGLARERSGGANMPSPHKKLSPVARANQRLPKNSLQNGYMLMVKVTHIENPQLFHVVKMDAFEDCRALKINLNYKYKNPENALQQIFVAPLQMCCAVRIEDVWHRARVEEIRSGGKICVHLVDEGSQQEVDWRQIYQLSNKFRSQKEFAIKCALADVEPLQENNYSWTKEAIREFSQLTANPILQMTIISTNLAISRVALHVCKKHMDINIAAMLVKYRHCISTGESAQVVEVLKTQKKRLSLPMNPLANIISMGGADLKTTDMSLQGGKEPTDSGTTKATNNPVKVLKRTPVKVVHIVDPGEFYIQIISLATGITKFHNQLQQAQAEAQADASNFSLNSQNTTNWFVGNHCLIYTIFKNPHIKSSNQSQCEWYRGIIISIASEIKGNTYTVFLRDIGATISGITNEQLSAIDHQWDRVTNAVHRCNLACIEPTGGMLVWSHSAIDCFQHTVNKYESLSATLQGKRMPGTNSLPIVLWGTITETEDPLAPCISRHSIINRILVKAGLAHSVQRLDVTEQLDKLLQLELAEGEITMEEWNRNFASNTALKDIDLRANDPGFNEPDTDALGKLEDNGGGTKKSKDIDLSFDKDLNNEACGEPKIYTSKAPEAWLHTKPINKSIFAAMPTYVDYDAIIYLHDANDEDLLNNLRTKIMKIYSEYQLPIDFKPTYLPGQGCLVRYHVDTRLYRGIVQELKNNEYIVQFIDYGNVESATIEELLPFAPFPNLPALAHKYYLKGIRSKSDNGIYSTDVLDIMHATVVEKLVSVRVETFEVQKPIKACSMRLGNIDVAENLINGGHVQRASLGAKKKYINAVERKQQQQELLRAITKKGDDAKANGKVLTTLQVDKMLGFKPIQTKDINDDVDDDEANPHQIIYDDDNDETVNDCLDQLIYNLDNNDDDDDIYVHSDDSYINDELNNALSPMNAAQAARMAQQAQSPQQTFVPPCKKRMFDTSEYKQLHKQMLQENLYGSENFMQNELAAMQNVNDCCVGGAAADGGTSWGIDEDDEDAAVVELEQSFALNYWHTTDDERERQKINHKKNMKDLVEHAAEQEKEQEMILHDSAMFTLRPRQYLETSAFEKFFPNDTSSVFSHYSGIESFKHPQLPIGKRTFECSVVCIVTPTIVHILPHFTEFEYRELELQRRIKHLVKSAPTLNDYEPRTICLSLNQKDKKWYRAIIRSHNPIAKQVDVLFVDYLNTTTVPITHLKQCPLELISWPLRTIRARLHGLIPNPRLREKDIRQALQNIVTKRTLVARIVKEVKSGGGTNVGGSAGVSDDNHCTSIANMTDLMDPKDIAEMSTPTYETVMEVELYNSNADVNNLRIALVYEPLVKDSFYTYKSSG